MKIVKTAVCIAAAAIGLLTAAMGWSAQRVTVKRHTLSVGEDAGDALVVFFISDIHRRKVPQKLLAKVRSTGRTPDLVIIGGDLAEQGVPVGRVRQNVQRLAELGPVYYIWGNNDREIGEGTVRSIIAEAGGVILDNVSVRIPGHPDWIISGADDPSSGNTDLLKANAFSGPYVHRLAAMHNPSSFGKIASMAAPALLVGGHTHGGQIRFGPFGMQPRGAFKDLGGRGELISNGFGTTLIPLRFGAPPETHLITVSYNRRSGGKQHDQH